MLLSGLQSRSHSSDLGDVQTQDVQTQDFCFQIGNKACVEEVTHIQDAIITNNKLILILVIMFLSG